MGKVISIRLDEKTRRAVLRAARARRRTSSEIIREAIELFVERQSLERAPYEAWKDVLGTAEGLPKALSEQTGERMRALLLERQRRRDR